MTKAVTRATILISCVLLHLAIETTAKKSNPLPEIWNDIVMQSSKLPKCQSCAHSRELVETSLTEYELRTIRIENVKQTILRKLGLTHPPKIVGPPVPLPQPIRYGDIKIDDFPKDDGPLLHSERIIVLGTGRQIQKSGDFVDLSFTIDIPATVIGADVKSGYLWVYTGSINVSGCFLKSEVCRQMSQNGNEVRKIPIIVLKEKAGWYKLDVTWTLGAWLEYSEMCQNISLTCFANKERLEFPEGKDPTRKPFLVVGMSPTLPSEGSRGKRNINCVKESTECCRESLQISFNEIGWGDWIYYPSTYNAYYCKGSCTNAASVTLGSAPYHSVMKKLYYLTLSQGNHLEVASCCTPTRLSPLQVIYKDQNNTLLQRIIQDLSVDSCGCM